MALDPSRIINGSFGYAYIDGEWQTNVNHCEAKVDGNKKELNLCGTDWTTHKLLSKKGTGIMSGFKVTSKMVEQGFKRFELITKLDDPEAFGYERIRYMNCMADSISLSNYTAGEEVAEETPFTFEDYELLDKITAS